MKNIDINKNDIKGLLFSLLLLLTANECTDLLVN